MSIERGDTIRRVLLADGWHSVVRGSYDDDDEITFARAGGQPWIRGAKWREVREGRTIHVLVPLKGILAVEQA